ncbi:MAG: YicC family protein [candidate division WOR-3 bacterium]|nr:MAG: YicC family protein [candidate division WOR-3 bacterium]
MIKSMTGVGHAEGMIPPWNSMIVVDIRSVNHKYFEIVPRLPNSLAGHESEIRDMVRRRVKRGYVQLHVTLDEHADAPTLSLDQRMTHDYLKIAHELRRKYKVKGELDINTVLNHPGIIAAAHSEKNRARLWRYSRRVLNSALDHLTRMRQAEGANMVRDLRRRVVRIQSAVRKIEERVPVRLRERKKNLLTQLRDLGIDADPKRLLEEVAFIADKVDIHEECVRLKSHCSMFLRALRVATTSGKKLDFIAQEMLRETDTLAAKARDMVVSRRAIEIKGEIEKLKEQVRNVE